MQLDILKYSRAIQENDKLSIDYLHMVVLRSTVKGIAFSLQYSCDITWKLKSLIYLVTL